MLSSNDMSFHKLLYTVTDSYMLSPITMCCNLQLCVSVLLYAAIQYSILFQQYYLSSLKYAAPTTVYNSHQIVLSNYSIWAPIQSNDSTIVYYPHYTTLLPLQCTDLTIINYLQIYANMCSWCSFQHALLLNQKPYFIGRAHRIKHYICIYHTLQIHYTLIPSTLISECYSKFVLLMNYLPWIIVGALRTSHHKPMLSLHTLYTSDSLYTYIQYIINYKQF